MATDEQRIKDIKEEIIFLQQDLESILLSTGILTKYEKLAIKIILARMQLLKEQKRALENK